MWAMTFLLVVCRPKIHPAINNAMSVKVIKKTRCLDPIPKIAPSFRTSRKFKILPGIATTPWCIGIGVQFGFERSWSRSRMTGELVIF